MSRQLKKYEIKEGKRVLMRQPHIVIIGHDPEKNAIQLNIQGRISFEEMVDMFNTALYELLLTFEKEAGKAEGIDKKQLKQDVYDKAVLGFSLMVDKFHPEAKNDKYEGFTNEAILEAQNAKLKRQIAERKSKEGTS